MNITKTVIYGRVSTNRQEFRSQIDEMEDYCRRRRWKDPTIIKDRISGGSFTRKGLDQLMDSVRRGKVKRIVSFKLDRLGRSLPHLAQLIMEFDTHGVALIIPSQGIDTSESNPAARLQLNVLLAVAEFETEMIRERVNAGLKAAKARGVKLGRPTVSDHLKKQVARLKKKGLGIREIGRELGMPPSTVHKLISSPSQPTRTH